MIGTTIKASALKTAFSYIEKNPEQNTLRLMDWVDRIAGTGEQSFPTQRAAVRKALEDPDNNMNQLVMSLFHDVDTGVVKTLFKNFIINSNIVGWPVQENLK